MRSQAKILWSKNIIGSFGYESTLTLYNISGWVGGSRRVYVVAQPSILLWRKIDDITLYFLLRGKIIRKRSLSPLFVQRDFMKTKENKNYINHNFVLLYHPNSSFISARLTLLWMCLRETYSFHSRYMLECTRFGAPREQEILMK